MNLALMRRLAGGETTFVRPSGDEELPDFRQLTRDLQVLEVLGYVRLQLVPRRRSAAQPTAVRGRLTRLGQQVLRRLDRPPPDGRSLTGGRQRKAPFRRKMKDSLPTKDMTDRPETAPQGRGETLLLVGDEPELRAFMAEYFHRLGYRILQATDASAALVLVQEFHIDLVIADDALRTAEGGHDLARRLRGAAPMVRVVLLTASAELGSDLSSLALFDGLLQKPFRMGDAGRIVRAALDDGRA